MHSRLTVAIISTLLAGLFALGGCGRGEAPGGDRLELVVATIPPIRGLIRPLLPETIGVVTLVEPGQNAHGHRLTPAQVATARTADVLFAVGMGMEEGALEQFQRDRPAHQQIAVFAELVDAGLSADAHAEHDHAAGERASHADMHVWTDPVLCAEFVQAASAMLIERVHAAQPSLAADIAARRDAMLARIRTVDAAYAERLAPFSGQSVLTQHPAFARMLARYGMHEFSLSATSGHAGPSAAELSAALATVRDRGVVAVFLEPQAPSALPRRIAEQAGLPIGTLDPLGSGDWEAMMHSNLDALVATLTQASARP
ncbi:MAG: zinc ABC transporter substrate-binding protein [Cyanobacteria bacterium CYA]|nr:MAG: zinc ABC transporter substrate-binding protein [Cyanobacteria bacterium CYA]